MSDACQTRHSKIVGRKGNEQRTVLKPLYTKLFQCSIVSKKLDLDFFMLLRFSAKHFFIIDSGFFLLFHFGITNFVLSAKISHAKGCVCKINKSNFKTAEYFVVPINPHTTAF